MSHVIITGATGMVGKGVLLSCLKDPSIEKITIISRRSLGLIDSKIEEVLLQDFANLEELKEQLNPADACFHCMGVSSLGLSKEDYYSKTFIYTKSLADLCFQVTPKGAAMISAALYKKPIVVHLENPQINAWAQKVRAT